MDRTKFCHVIGGGGILYEQRALPTDLWIKRLDIRNYHIVCTFWEKATALVIACYRQHTITSENGH